MKTVEFKIVFSKRGNAAKIIVRADDVQLFAVTHRSRVVKAYHDLMANILQSNLARPHRTK